MIEGLYQYLIFIKKYTYDEAYETCVRYEVGMELPEEVKKDVKEWKNKNYR